MKSQATSDLAEPADPPVVSVILLSYNQEPYVRQAVESLMSQECSFAWQIVVADDASTDGTLGIVKEVVGDRPNVLVLPADRNVGMQANFRRALQATTGRFVAILEGDDYWTAPDKLQVMVDLLEGQPSMAAAGHLTTEVGLGVPDGKLFAEGFGGKDRLTFEDVIQGRFPHASGLMFRRQLFPTTPEWFDGLRAADLLICSMLTLDGDITVVQRSMSVYRRNLQSTWTPLPPLERRLDMVKQWHALKRNVRPLPPAFDVELALATRRLFSTMRRSRSPRRIARCLYQFARSRASGFRSRAESRR